MGLHCRAFVGGDSLRRMKREGKPEEEGEPSHCCACVGEQDEEESQAGGSSNKTAFRLMGSPEAEGTC